jgi:hypothetical protein
VRLPLVELDEADKAVIARTISDLAEEDLAGAVRA